MHAQTRSEPPWAELDAGVVEIVRALWNAGLEPTDSGDGSKAQSMDCAVSFPMVALASTRTQITDDMRLAMAVLERLGEWQVEGSVTLIGRHEVWVILCYCEQVEAAHG